MAKCLTINHNSNTYRLQFNRKTVVAMEQNGFRADELLTQPASMIPRLFYGAFQMNHKNIRRELVDEIYLSLPNKEGLLEALVELYNEPIAALIEDSADGEEKNATWVLS